MSGHSKWSNTKHRKEIQDMKRGKIFTKIIRELTCAARIGGGDINSNPRLRSAIDKALLYNMTRDTLNRAILRGIGTINKIDITESITYEGYGPGNTAIMVECYTNNRHRIASEIRYAFSRNGGHLGTRGSVSYLFDKFNVISFLSILDIESIFELASEYGAYDVFNDNSKIEIYIKQDNLNKIKKILKERGLIPDFYKIVFIPFTYIKLNQEMLNKFLNFITVLKKIYDVQEIFHNVKL